MYAQREGSAAATVAAIGPVETGRNGQPAVTIVIPTFRRPQLLRRVVESCLRQAETVDAFDMLIVDNCPAESARATVTALADNAALPIRYLHEPRPGVSHARNAGLGAAGGDFIVFIDDDEIAGPGWLAALLDTQATYEADVVLGPVVAALQPGDHAAMGQEAMRLLSCDSDAPTGSVVGSTVITPFWKRGRAIYPKLGCGNVLLRRTSARLTGAAFDPRLGRTGGEDTLFLTQLAARGARIVWCREAMVVEPVQQERENARFLGLRAFRGGQGQSWLPMILKPRQPLLTLLSMAIGAAQAPVYAAMALALRLAGSPRWPEVRYRALAGIGKVLWMAPFRADAYGMPPGLVLSPRDEPPA